MLGTGKSACHHGCHGMLYQKRHLASLSPIRKTSVGSRGSEHSKGALVARRALDLDIDLPEIDLDLRSLQNDRGAVVEVSCTSRPLARFCMIALWSHVIRRMRH